MKRVLVACEFSGTVRDQFTKLGHDATSCDLLPTESPGKHVQGDVREMRITDFDLLIAHPPCTYLCSAGARWWPGKERQQQEAIDFFMWFVAQKIPRAIENPVGIVSSVYRKPDQIIQPWQFGHGETKATCLWLYEVPKLIPTNIVEGRKDRIHRMSQTKNRWKRRSLTYPGIAQAIAEQWGSA